MINLCTFPKHLTTTSSLFPVSKPSMNSKPFIHAVTYLITYEMCRLEWSWISEMWTKTPLSINFHSPAYILILHMQSFTLLIYSCVFTHAQKGEGSYTCQIRQFIYYMYSISLEEVIDYVRFIPNCFPFKTAIGL